MLRFVQGTFASSRKRLAEPQGASASRSSHQEDADGAAEDQGELDVLEGGEEEEKEEEAVPEVPRPSQAPLVGPSASRSSRPVSPSTRPSKKARK